MKEKIGKCDCMKINNYCTAKDNTERKKGQATYGKKNLKSYVTKGELFNKWYRNNWLSLCKK